MSLFVSSLICATHVSVHPLTLQQWRRDPKRESLRERSEPRACGRQRAGLPPSSARWERRARDNCGKRDLQV